MKRKKLAMNLMKTSHLVMRNVDTAVTNAVDKQLTSSQARMVRYIGFSDEKDLYQKDLEKVFGLKRSSISLLLDNMQKNELIERKSVDGDARLKKIVLTDRAKDMCEKIDGAIFTVEQRAFEGISDEEVDIMFKVMEQVRDNLSK